MEWGLPHGALCVLLSPPCSPQLLTTSGYTCSGEFRFQTERCFALAFCRTSIKSRHILSLGGPVVREGEPLTACCFHTPLKPPPPTPLLILDNPHAPPYHHDSRFKNEKCIVNRVAGDIPVSENWQLSCRIYLLFYGIEKIFSKGRLFAHTIVKKTGSKFQL